MKKKILIIDDSESIRELLYSNLSAEGFDVIKAENGQDALDKINDTNLSLIITDVNMPIMDGISFIKEARKIKETAHLPILVLTTETQISKKNEAKINGATGWIVKPFSKDKLLKVIQKVIR